MALPIDRGIVAVRDERDGTMTVMVCTEVRDNRPVGVYATHTQMPAERVRVEMPLRRSGSIQYSSGIAEVYWDPSGDLSIRPIAHEGM